MELPDGAQVDIIVSEWMGFYLLHESMLDSVIAARDKHLKPDGIMLPSKATLYAAPCRLSDFNAEQVDFWKEVYGFDMTPVGDAILRSKKCKPEIMLIKDQDLLSKPVQVSHFDLAWVGLDEIQSVSSRCFTSIDTLDATLYQGVCLWFDCSFEFATAATECETNDVVLSTCPRSPPTHWKQSVVVLPSPIAVEEGDVIGWELNLVQSVQNRRHYVIELNLLDPDTEEHPVPCTCGQAKCVIIAAYLDKEEQELRQRGHR